ncbi:hypothetical protein A3752_05775 [Oleiphilus sp. HI0081]|uniref:hypothetical protein n=1 Tax=unclassified Oleiphilus TaxID=2631174 RepID=UPI0007C298AD|nr:MULTISPECIES: hypothetical protein [unclassified Oleiphilus]KZY73227.1 hypothetical protein A3740_19500 [Oleiphilus sp. HI0068]KZY86435.1 hypothetical protein A3741_14435 [Oleiphilus sp. HI0069]KZY96272.1 hypothetical protein A3743_04705 [Oleiphilus sp. HI0072]KZZ16879.1 hypothetical protein A3749_04360 [Oleiphilus sp. HI0078]KZZ23173.1 hypothetical protein A3752_05775 [Oleiphilus sp. HI0081]
MKKQDISSNNRSGESQVSVKPEPVDESWALALLNEALIEEAAETTIERAKTTVGKAEQNCELSDDSVTESLNDNAEVFSKAVGSNELPEHSSSESLQLMYRQHSLSADYAHSNEVHRSASLSAIQMQQIVFNEVKKFNAESEKLANRSCRNWLARLIAKFTGRS